MLKSKGITNFVSEKVKFYYQMSIKKKIKHTHSHTQNIRN